ncbi:acyl carrier protein [Aquimarina sp. 2-A2]|uniref:Acyl carrier protein n=1 Tax=Aquimarina intermedia TaxID=350814 RepID=A0A5S5C6V6_9FLAO|nr:acyl carrier protein [Aquimarina intermedia]TYP75161.1 acyl carrier protein [Aquimarina intermedia]
MEKDKIYENVTQAFRKVLEHENFNLKDTTSADDVEGWESITHMMIITEIENQLNIKFKLMDLMNMHNVGDLVKSIDKELHSN